MCEVQSEKQSCWKDDSIDFWFNTASVTVKTSFLIPNTIEWTLLPDRYSTGTVSVNQIGQKLIK